FHGRHCTRCLTAGPSAGRVVALSRTGKEVSDESRRSLQGEHGARGGGGRAAGTEGGRGAREGEGRRRVPQRLAHHERRLAAPAASTARSAAAFCATATTTPRAGCSSTARTV